MRLTRIERIIAGVATCALAACSAIVDLNGLASGGADASAQDASTDALASGDGLLADGTSSGVTDGAQLDGGSPGDASNAPDASWFTDDFDRGDAAVIGNDWVMKYPPAFELASGRVERLFPDSNHDFPDNIVYRPLGESMLDVSVSIDLFLGASPPGYPQIHARIQPSTAAVTGQLDSYILFVTDAENQGEIARQHGGSSGYVSLATFTISPALSTSNRYRMILTVTGAKPVTITGVIQDITTSPVKAVGMVTALDSDPTQITAPGTVGFAGGRPEVNGNYFFDNFVREPR
jgi:hypothetical protein